MLCKGGINPLKGALAGKTAVFQSGFKNSWRWVPVQLGASWGTTAGENEIVSLFSRKWSANHSQLCTNAV